MRQQLLLKALYFESVYDSRLTAVVVLACVTALGL